MCFFNAETVSTDHIVLGWKQKSQRQKSLNQDKYNHNHVHSSTAGGK